MQIYQSKGILLVRIKSHFQHDSSQCFQTYGNENNIHFCHHGGLYGRLGRGLHAENCVGDITQKVFGLIVINGESSKLTGILLPPSCYAMDCFHFALLLGATLCWSQPTMDWNLYRLWTEIKFSSFNFGSWLFCLSNKINM